MIWQGSELFTYTFMHLKELLTQKWKFTHPQTIQGIDEFFFMGTDLEKLSIPSLAHQWVLCSEWVPSEWWTGVVWITCGLLWCWRNKLIYTLHAILGVLFILGWTMPLRQTKAFIQNNLHCIQSIHLSVQNSQCNSKGQRVENLVNL